MRKKYIQKIPQPIEDLGRTSAVVNIGELSHDNTDYRRSLFTGEYMQITLMSIPVGGEVGLEIHENTDQFIQIEEGVATVCLGTDSSCSELVEDAGPEWAIIIAAGTWHNIVNAGKVPLKLCSVYAPSEYPFGTVQKTIEDAENEERMKRTVKKTQSENNLYNYQHGRVTVRNPACENEAENAEPDSQSEGTAQPYTSPENTDGFGSTGNNGSSDSISESDRSGNSGRSERSERSEQSETSGNSGNLYSRGTSKTEDSADITPESEKSEREKPTPDCYGNIPSEESEKEKKPETEEKPGE